MGSRSCVGLGGIIVIGVKEIARMQIEKIKSLGKKDRTKKKPSSENK